MGSVLAASPNSCLGLKNSHRCCQGKGWDLPSFHCTPSFSHSPTLQPALEAFTPPTVRALLSSRTSPQHEAMLLALVFFREIWSSQTQDDWRSLSYERTAELKKKKQAHKLWWQKYRSMTMRPREATPLPHSFLATIQRK